MRDRIIPPQRRVSETACIASLHPCLALHFECATEAGDLLRLIANRAAIVGMLRRAGREASELQKRYEQLSVVPNKKGHDAIGGMQAVDTLQPINPCRVRCIFCRSGIDDLEYLRG